MPVEMCKKFNTIEILKLTFYLLFPLEQKNNKIKLNSWILKKVQ